MRIAQREAVRYEDDRAAALSEQLAVEAPLQILINSAPYAAMLRTPGEDVALVSGLLFSEGIAVQAQLPLSMRLAHDPETGLVAAVDVAIDPAVPRGLYEKRRALMATSSCGLCGTREARDFLWTDTPPRLCAPAPLPWRLVGEMHAALHAGQSVFLQTGGCHGAALFAMDGTCLAVAEDVGRHNAVDKVVGHLLQHRTLERAQCLAVSGRVSYEIVFKAFRARIPFIMAVSAPSSMAVDMADRFGMTVIGFCRGSRATVYTHPEQMSADC